MNKSDIRKVKQALKHQPAQVHAREVTSAVGAAATAMPEIRHFAKGLARETRKLKKQPTSQRLTEKSALEVIFALWMFLEEEDATDLLMTDR